MATTDPRFYKSLTLKLTNVGKNQIETLPDRIDVYGGQLILKSYCVQFDTDNSLNNEVNVNIYGISQISNVNNSMDFLTLPVSRNGDKTTFHYTDTVCFVQGHRLNPTIRYDLLDDSSPPTDTFNGNVPVAVYLTFQYLSTGI